VSDEATSTSPVATEPVALLFPGQGSQAPGMGKLVYDHSAAARSTYEEASDITGMDIARLCFHGEEEELSETSVTQPAVLTTSVASAAAMREKLAEVGRLMRPRLFGGHSLGLFSSAVASEAIEFRDAMLLIMERARLMSTMYRERPVGMTTVIGLDHDTIQELCDEATASPMDRVDVANHNLDNQFTISGDVTALERAMERARSLRAKVIRLKVKVSSHTPLHVEQAEEFAQMLRDVEFHDPQRPIISNATSQPLVSGEDVKGEFAAQLRSPVYWAENVREMARQGVDNFIEAGPGHVLARLVRRISSEATSVSLADATDDPVPISVLPTAATISAELAR
jgi:[acyl-carrier-protein] S-malonyltransferase